MSEYIKTYTSFSGVDIVPTITPLGGKPLVIGELQTVSYSIHREKYPVYTLNSINPRGFCYGPRTIAGTLIFTVIDIHLVRKIINNNIEMFKLQSAPHTARKILKMDEMPPFDITITIHNEYGQRGSICIYGVEIVDEGQTMSIEDLMTEQTMSYLARDIDLFHNPEKDYDPVIPGVQTYTPTTTTTGEPVNINGQWYASGGGTK